MNRNKSQIFFSPNVPIEMVVNICRIVGFVRVEDLRTHLGMPLIPKRVGVNTFDFMVNKVQNRLNDWEPKKFSLAGRITLTKSILLSIPNYFKATVRIPISVCGVIEKLACNFIWGPLVKQGN